MNRDSVEGIRGFMLTVGVFDRGVVVGDNGGGRVRITGAELGGRDGVRRDVNCSREEVGSGGE